MDRRMFLRGALSLGTITAAGLPALALPRIVGDGVFDDADGLQAFIDGRPFSVDGEGVIARDGILSGRFMCRKGLVFRGLRDFTFDGKGADFMFELPPSEEYAMFVDHTCAQGVIEIGRVSVQRASTIDGYSSGWLGGGYHVRP